MVTPLAIILPYRQSSASLRFIRLIQACPNFSALEADKSLKELAKARK